MLGSFKFTHMTDPVRKSAFLAGAVDTLALILAAIPFGVLYGALAQSTGLSVWTTMAMSLFVFAGSAQFVAVNLLMAAAPVLVVIITTFFVNLRHMMYSANLVGEVRHLPGGLRAIMAFWLTDETFAVVAGRADGRHAEGAFHWYYLGSALSMYLNWQICTYAGFQLGARLPDPGAWGLDFAMVVAFIGVVVPLLKGPATWVCALSAFVLSLITRDWPYQSGLLFTMLMAIAIAMLVNRARGRADA